MMKEAKLKVFVGEQNTCELSSKRFLQSMKGNKLFIVLVNAKRLLLWLDVKIMRLFEYFMLYTNITEDIDKMKEFVIKVKETYSLKKIYMVIYAGTNDFVKVYLMTIIGTLIDIKKNAKESSIQQEVIKEEDDKEVLKENETYDNVLCEDIKKKDDIITEDSKENEEKDITYKSNEFSFETILYDIQHLLTRLKEPMNVFFIRYFIIHSLKDKLELISIDISGPFLLENLREMNKMHKLIIKQNPENKTDESFITILIQENIQLLVSLTSIKPDFFESDVFPLIIDLIYDNSDNTYQQYILDWIITGFSEEFTLKNLNKILNRMYTLYPVIDLEIPQKIKIILNRILTFLRVNSIQKETLSKDLQCNFNEAFEYILQVITHARRHKISMNLFFEFTETIMTFIRCCSMKPEQGKYANRILQIFNGYLSDIIDKQSIDNAYIKRYNDMIHGLLRENNITVFDLEYTRLIAQQFNSKTTIDNYYNILDWMLRYRNIIDSTVKISLVNDIIKEVFEDHKSQYYSKRWNVINSLMDMIHNKDPGQTAQCYIMLIGSISHYDWDGSYEQKQAQTIQVQASRRYSSQEQILKRQFTQIAITRHQSIISDESPEEDSLTHFYTCLLDLIHTCEIRFLIKEGIITETEKDKDPTTGNDLPQIDIDKQTEEEILVLISFFYTEFKNDIKKYTDYPQISLNALLKGIKQIDGHQVGRLIMMFDNYLELYNLFIQILLEESVPSNLKVEYLIQLVEVIKEATIIPKPQYVKIITHISLISKSLQKRSETIRVNLAICDLYYNNNHTDITKIKELIVNSIEEGGFAIAKIENLPIFPWILKTILKFMDKSNQILVPIASINDIIQAINNNIPYLKENNKRLGMEVQKMYNESKRHILKMKEEGIDYYEGIQCEGCSPNDDDTETIQNSCKSAKYSK